MKNLITYLKTLWSWVADSQSTDVSLDCRLTVGSPSFRRRSTMLKLVSVLVLMLTVGSGNAWGAEDDTAYTLTCTQNSSNTAYANTFDVVINYKTWNAPGNQNAGSGWRVGGAKGTNVSRYITGKSTIDKPIKKITVNHNGRSNSNLTINSFSVTVSKNSDFSSPIETKTVSNPSVSSAGSFDLTPTSSPWPSGCYYKFTLVYTHNKSSNYGLDLTSLVFVEGASGSVPVTGVSVSPTTKSIVPGETFAITPTISPAGATDKVVSWTSSATSKATVSNGTVTGVAAGTSTITCTTHDGGFTATCAVTVRGVTLQARDEDGNTIAVGGPGSPSRTGASITPAADANNYVFKQWQITNASLGTDATTKSNTITNPTGAVTVTAVYYKPITITYKANSQNFTTQTYAYGEDLAFPVSDPDPGTYSCDGKTFVGWVAEANKDYSHASTPPTYATAGGDVTAAATYYAVFATSSGEISTSYAAITSGLETANYVIAYSYNGGTQIVLKNTADNSSPSDKLEGYNLSLSASKYSDPAAAYIWALQAQPDGSYYIYNANVNKYVNATTSALTLSTTPTKFTISYDGTNSRWTIQIKDNSTYYIHGYVSGSDYDFRVSTSGSGNRYRIYLYKQESNITYADYTTSCSCASYSFHDGTHDVSDWQISCFEYSGNSDRQWIKNFTVRNKPKYYVGKQGNFYNSALGNNNAKSYENDMQYMQLALDRGHNSNNQLGSNYAGVQGTVLCYDNSSSDNLYVDFLPDGYYFLLDAANTPTALPMTCTDADMTAANILSHNTVWETEIQTVTSVSYKYSVGIKADAAIAGQAWQKTRYNTNEDMTSLQKRNASSGFTGSLAAADVSAKARGKYRIWANNFSTTAGQKNWYAHFVPYIGVTYYDTDNSSVFEQTSDANAVSIEADANDKKFTITSSEPTKANYTFVGWNTSANQTTATYTSGQTNVALSAWTYLYPAFTENPKANVIVNPSSNGSVVADHTTNVYQGTTVTLTITPSSGYQLSSISAVDGSSNPVSLTGTGNSRTFTMPASNVTVTATFVVRTDYVLVTNVSELNDGDVITIANMKGNYAEGKILHSQADNNRNTKAVTTAADGKIADSDVEYPITLVSDASGWKLYDQENAGYLYAVKGSNYLKNSATPTPTYNDVWTIEIVQTAGDYQYQARIHQTPCNGGGCGQESSKDRYIEFNGSVISGYLYTMTDGYIYKKELGCDKLAAPTGLTASSITQTTVTLSWNSVTNASGYEISLNNGSSWTSTSTNTSYNATGLTAGTTYNWKVRATGTGDYCDKGNAASSTVTMKNAVKVTYKTNGATGGQLPVAGGVVNLTEGDSHTILGNTGSGGSPTPLTKTGYVFDGWHSSSTYSSTPAYTIGSSITVNSNVDIYANWKPKKDTFVDAVHNTATQYGEGYNYTIPSCSDQTRNTSGTCEETHYKFKGWALAGADLTNPSNIIHAGDTQTASGTDANPKTYYAVWAEEL